MESATARTRALSNAAFDAYRYPPLAALSQVLRSRGLVSTVIRESSDESLGSQNIEMLLCAAYGLPAAWPKPGSAYAEAPDPFRESGAWPGSQASLSALKRAATALRAGFSAIAWARKNTASWRV